MVGLSSAHRRWWKHCPGGSESIQMVWEAGLPGGSVFADERLENGGDLLLLAAWEP